MHDYCLMPLVRFLVLEGDGDCVGEGDVAIGVWTGSPFGEESDVLETDDFCSSISSSR